MAMMTAGGTPTCVSWLLLASHVALLGVGGLGVWMSVINFGYDEALPPTPPPKNDTNTTTTTTPTPERQYYYRENNREEVPKAYKDYVSRSESFAHIMNDARFYVAPLCFVCVMVASLTLVAGLFSRRLFTSTFSLYSSLALWILTLVMTSMYQNAMALDELPFSQHSVGWVTGCHVLLLLFLLAQMVMCIWELRRQEMKSWPTINLLNVFTLEAALLASQLTLTFFSLASLFDSRLSGIIAGLRGKTDTLYEWDYYGPRIRYPLEFSFVCFAAAFYHAVATLETTLSLLLGKLHRHMTTLTCLLSGLCCVTVAALSSPAFVRTFIGPYVTYPSTMNFFIGLSVVTFLHWLVCLFFSSTARTPPHILTQITDGLFSATCLDDVTGIINSQWMKGVKGLTMKKSSRHSKEASLIFLFISMVIIGVSAGSTPCYRIWGHIMLLCANSVIVMQMLPLVVMKSLHEEEDGIAAKRRLLVVAITTPVLLAGGIAACTNSYDGLGIFGGVLNIFFSTTQMFGLWCLFKKPREQHNEDNEAAKRLTLAEEVTNQDDDKNNLTDALA